MYEERKIQHLCKIIVAEEQDPMRSLSLQHSSIKPVLFQAQPGVKRRIGKPRIKWVETTLESLWKSLGETTRADLKGAIMNLDNEEHVKAIKEAATTNVTNKQSQKRTSGESQGSTEIPRAPTVEEYLR